MFSAYARHTRNAYRQLWAVVASLAWPEWEHQHPGEAAGVRLMARDHQVRHCTRCGTRLARDNNHAMCGPCQVATRDVLLRPPVLPLEFWQIDQMWDALATWHMGRVIFAY